MSVTNVMLMLATVVMTVAMMSTGMVTLIVVMLWRIQKKVSSYMKSCTLHQVEDYSKPDISTPKGWH